MSAKEMSWVDPQGVIIEFERDAVPTRNTVRIRNQNEELLAVDRIELILDANNYPTKMMAIVQKFPEKPRTPSPTLHWVIVPVLEVRVIENSNE